MRIAIALTVLKPYQRTQSGLSSEPIREWIADMLVDRIMGRPNEETVLIEPDIVGPPYDGRRGIWGVDEPHPFPNLMPD